MIVNDMREANYHALPAFSSTQARQILDSPARYKWGLTHFRPDTAAFDVGTAAHTKILGVGAGVIAYPDEHLTASGNVSTKASTVEWAREQRKAGLTPVSPDQLDAVNAMAEAVLANNTARALLEQEGTPEASVFGTDPATGIDMRARFDFLAEPRNGRRLTVDLKTTAGSASSQGFGRSAASFGYHVQRGHYLHTLELSTGERDAEMLFVVVEKEPPHLVAVHQLDLEFADMGVDQAEHARRILAECRATDTWPGYPEEVQLTRAPVWAIYDHIDRFGDTAVK